jgi:broad specificity phosphatase PhoE
MKIQSLSTQLLSPSSFVVIPTPRYGTTQTISSGARKAIETAEIIGRNLNFTVEVGEAMNEND